MTCLFGLLSCWPFSFNWNKEQPGRCNNLVAEFAAVAAIDIFVDLCLLFLPMRKVWSLQMPLPTRIALISVFGLGVLDMVMGIMRIVADLQVNFEQDWTYQTAALYFWSSIEPGLAIIISCAIVLRPLLERLLPTRFLRRTFYGSNPYQHGNSGNDTSGHGGKISKTDKSYLDTNKFSSTTSTAAGRGPAHINRYGHTGGELPLEELSLPKHAGAPGIRSQSVEDDEIIRVEQELSVQAEHFRGS